jgi:hypothetical protein
VCPLFVLTAAAFPKADAPNPVAAFTFAATGKADLAPNMMETDGRGTGQSTAALPLDVDLSLSLPSSFRSISICVPFSDFGSLFPLLLASFLPFFPPFVPRNVAFEAQNREPTKALSSLSR